MALCKQCDKHRGSVLFYRLNAYLFNGLKFRMVVTTCAKISD